MITFYMKNGLTIEVDDTLTEITRRGGDVTNIKWKAAGAGKRRLQNIDLAEVVAIVTGDGSDDGQPSEQPGIESEAR